MCVLLVEDDLLIRCTLIEFLEDAGLHVFEASDASEAIDIMRESNEKISVLVTDLNLGLGEDGLILAEKARLSIPHLRVVYATGNPEMLEGKSMQPWERAFIKPFDPCIFTSEVVLLDRPLQNSGTCSTWGEDGVTL